LICLFENECERVKEFGSYPFKKREREQRTKETIKEREREREEKIEGNIIVTMTLNPQSCHQTKSNPFVPHSH
jgi:hypothetical protein